MAKQRMINVEDFMNEVVKYPHQSLKTIGEALDKTPTVDAAPVVHGYWISIGEDKMGYTEEYKCSVCKSHITLGYYSTYCDYEFCPHCGARMDGEQDGKWI